MNRTLAILLVCACFSLTALTSAQASDQQKARELYNQGNILFKSKQYFEAGEALRASLQSSKNFATYYLLGMTYLAGKHPASPNKPYLENAEESFKGALGAANSRKKAAMAKGRIAQAYLLQGGKQLVAAKREIEEALKMTPEKAPTWMLAVYEKINAETVRMSSDQIVRSLTQNPLDSRFKPVDLTAPGPSLNLKINFQFDSTEVSQDSIANLSALSTAMKNEAFRKNRFLLIGHADARGDECHNYHLSQSRAKSISQWLDAQGNDLARIIYRGDGAKRPLYAAAETEDQHKINRRLEIVVMEQEVMPAEVDHGQCQ